MTELGWIAVRVRGLTPGGYREQVRGYCRDARHEHNHIWSKFNPPWQCLGLESVFSAGAGPSWVVVGICAGRVKRANRLILIPAQRVSSNMARRIRHHPPADVGSCSTG
jgi:hypothetical protein